MDIKLPLRIFAVDPATTKSGWALIELISINPLKIRVLKHAQIDGQKLLTRNKELSKIFQKQFCVLELLEQEYTNLLDEFKPDVVVSESAFGYTHMSAFMALSLAIHTLRKACRNVLNQDLVTCPPTISKKALTGSGAADKDQMKEALLNSSEITFEEEPVDITEHQIDAVAHGYAYIKVFITKEIIQVSAKEQKRRRREKAKEKERSS